MSNETWPQEIHPLSMHRGNGHTKTHHVLPHVRYSRYSNVRKYHRKNHNRKKIYYRRQHVSYPKLMKRKCKPSSERYSVRAGLWTRPTDIINANFLFFFLSNYVLILVLKIYDMIDSPYQIMIILVLKREYFFISVFHNFQELWNKSNYGDTSS